MIVNGTSLSMVEAHEALIRLERDSGMRGTYVQPTVVFLQRVQQWLQSFSVRVTLDGAWQFWRLVFFQTEVARNRAQLHADIAFWFGVDPYKLDEEQMLGLTANLHRVRAQDLLRRGAFRPTDYKAVYELVLLATGDEDEANRAKADALELHMENEIRKAAHHVSAR